MHNEFYAYINLRGIGEHYFQTLPATIQTAISEYNTNLFCQIGGRTYIVARTAHNHPAAPAAMPPPLSTRGPGWVAPGVPAPLTQQQIGQLGQVDADIRTNLGGTRLVTQSPFIYDHGSPGTIVNYGNDITVGDFITAWDSLVASQYGGAFAWPVGFHAIDHKLEFMAAAFAESSRDKCQLGAIYLLKQSGWRTFAAQRFVNVLPLCTGGTYIPTRLTKASDTVETFMASCTTWQRCWRIYQKNLELPHGVNQQMTATLSQGASLGGRLPNWAYDKCSKHNAKMVKAWWWS